MIAVRRLPRPASIGGSVVSGEEDLLRHGAVPDEFQLSVAALTAEVALVSVAGELDLSTSSRLREGVDEAASTGAKAVIVDLSGISFIDSTALGVLVHESKLL